MERISSLAWKRLWKKMTLSMVALIISCGDPTGLIGSVETTVMSANNKFLLVVSTSPTQQSLDVNPGQNITILFDRPIVESSLAGNVTIIRADTGAAFTKWERHYTAATRTLELRLLEPFAGNVPYTVTLERGIRGQDGSGLQVPMIWSFTTNDTVGGVFWFGVLSDQEHPLEYANLALSVLQGNNTVPVTISIQAASPAGISYWLTTDQSAAVNLTNPTWQSATMLTIPTSFDFASDGAYTLYMRIQDSEGVVAPLVSRPIVVDRTEPAKPGAPVLAASDDTGRLSNDGYTTRTTGLTFSGAAESGTTVELKSGATSLGTAACNGNWTVDNLSLAGGTYAIFAVATDTAGNRSADSNSTTIHIDTVDPSISTLSFSTGGAEYVRQSVTLTGDGADAVLLDYIEFFVDGVSRGSDLSAPYTFIWNTTSFADGSHSVYARCYDRAGRYRDSTVYNRSVDNTAPVFDLGNGVYTNTTYSFAPSISEANVGSYVWSGSGITFGSAGSSSTTADCTTDGQRTVTLTVTDKAGNVTSDSVPFCWDKSAPTAPDPPSAVVIAYEKILWSWSTGSDSLSGLSGTYRYSRDGGAWVTTTSQTCTYTKSTHLVSLPVYPGTYTLEVQAQDRAGNWSPSGSRSFDVTTQPVIPAPGATGVPVSINANWPDYPGAVFYLVYVGTSSANYDIVNGGYVVTSGLNPPTNLPGKQMFYWYYRACTGTQIHPITQYTSPEFNFKTE